MNSTKAEEDYNHMVSATAQSSVVGSRDMRTVSQHNNQNMIFKDMNVNNMSF